MQGTPGGSFVDFWAVWPPLAATNNEGYETEADAQKRQASGFRDGGSGQADIVEVGLDAGAAEHDHEVTGGHSRTGRKAEGFIGESTDGYEAIGGTQRVQDCVAGKQRYGVIGYKAVEAMSDIH